MEKIDVCKFNVIEPNGNQFEIECYPCFYKNDDPEIKFMSISFDKECFKHSITKDSIDIIFTGDENIEYLAEQLKRIIEYSKKYKEEHKL